MPVSDGTSSGNDRFVRDFLRAWERRDAVFIVDCFTEDAVYHSVPLSPIVGRAAIAEWVHGFDGVPTGRLEVHGQVATESVVMNERTMPSPSTGSRLSCRSAACSRCTTVVSAPGASTSTWRRPGLPSPTAEGPRAAPIYAAAMAYDEDLADRIRALLATQRGVTEKKMFGGLAFLVGGNMAIAASGQGGVLVRCDPEETDALVRTTKAEVAVMRGRAMAGWLRVDGTDVRTKPQLAKWVGVGTAYARELPVKR
jgi:limonene-1,2-epoxide hydrolase